MKSPIDIDSGVNPTIANQINKASNLNNSSPRSEFELLMTQVLGDLQEQGKKEEASNLFAFVGAANWILRHREGAPAQSTNDIARLIPIIESPTDIQKGTHLGQSESLEHFEKRKNAAIDILSEILQGIKG
ncbi:MAG: hypothetical protein K2N75_01115 [Helicobacter sp.]|uniref:hypothetical protein n=1 Tax=Helicobacter TaxID=209 RepID=UPI0023D5C73E|nr:hypothetical protein [Helicobacter sp.]MDE7174638.1 hypothetical protein [Helicobacter sp.]